MYMSDDLGDFSSEYGHGDDFSLSDVLWTCSSMLAKRYLIHNYIV